MLRGKPQTVVVENQNNEPNKANLLREYQELYDAGTITKEEFEALKQEVLNK